MASELVKELQNGQLLTTTNTTPVDLPDKTRDLIAHLVVSVINGATTLDVKLQHSPNKTQWYDLGTPFAQLVGVTGDEAVRITDSAFQFIRIVAALAGATQEATMVVNLHYDNQ